MVGSVSPVKTLAALLDSLRRTARRPGIRANLRNLASETRNAQKTASRARSLPVTGARRVDSAMSYAMQTQCTVDPVRQRIAPFFFFPECVCRVLPNLATCITRTGDRLLGNASKDVLQRRRPEPRRRRPRLRDQPPKLARDPHPAQLQTPCAIANPAPSAESTPTTSMRRPERGPECKSW